MKAKYDVVIYFYWAPAQVIHKYLSFHNKLKKFCNVLTIIGKGEFGISKEQFDYFEDKHKIDVVLKSTPEALKILDEVDYKIGIFSSNGRKGYVNPDGTEPHALGAKYPATGKDIEIAKRKGALTIQISEMITDFYYAGADIASLVSPAMKDIHLNPKRFGTHHKYQWRPFDARPEPKYIYSNCLLWDKIEDCIPYISREQFCEKYNLNKNKDIFVYLPSMTWHVIHGLAKKVYKQICSMDNVVVKLHPNEYTRMASGRVQNKWSNEICGVEDVSVLDPLDTHWCYEYASCAMSNQSSVSIELGTPYHATPFLYVAPPNFPLSKFFLQFGSKCSMENLNTYLKNKEYKNKIENLDKFYDIILTDSKRKSADILSEQIKGLLNDNVC